jgi:methylated-DNA-[protein]-cysteine S-methyltransferase
VFSVPTALGPLRVERTAHGICRLEFRRGGRRAGAGERDWVRQLQAHAAGRPVRFRVRLDLRAGTPFQRAVWRLLQTIPRGQTRSYGWVARQLGRPGAARAVGAACGANPVPILVPCHRVVAGNGTLGGFRSGLSWKRRLLALEGVRIVGLARGRAA